nr:hypothetical protein [uncultured Sphingomonas sp.]
MQRRDLIRRPTVMAAAFSDMLEKLGHDTSNVRIPSKREPSWRVTRKG